MPDHHNKRVIYQRFRDRMSDCSDGLLQFLLWCSLIQSPGPERARVARGRRAAGARRKE
jgi:hypothetical protein